jgi:hypothetical protein
MIQTLNLHHSKDFPSSPGLQHHFSHLSSPSYGNSAAKLLESQTKSSISSNNGRQGTARPTISTYRLSSNNIAQPTHIISPLPTSPPYTAGHSGGLFYSPSMHQHRQLDPTTPNSDSDSSSDVFNPYPFNIGHPSSQVQLQSSQQDPAAAQTHHDAELYSYPSSYEHTLLPSGFRLASPFGSPASSPTTRNFLPTSLLDESGDMVVRGLQINGSSRNEDQSYADNENSSDETYSIRKSFITPRKECENEKEDHCRVFANKTSPFDPFIADGYQKRISSSELSVKLPKTPGYLQERAQQVDAEAMDDSARRCSGGVEEVASGEEESGTSKPEDEKQVFCGSSRYLLVSRSSNYVQEFLSMLTMAFSTRLADLMLKWMRTS